MIGKYFIADALAKTYTFWASIRNKHVVIKCLEEINYSCMVPSLILSSHNRFTYLIPATKFAINFLKSRINGESTIVLL